jgi:DNA-directed RNA polymerase specialized sigma24 family protein
VEAIAMSEQAETSIMDVVPMSSRRSGRFHDEFCDLFAATYPQVVRTVWFVVHDQSIAEEIAQDAFTELYRGWSRLRTYDRPDLWVRRVVLEQTAGRLALVDSEIPLPDPELIAAIRALPPKQRAIVVLFYLEDRPMNEVADLVGCSSSTGFVQLHQARKRLAAALSEEVGSDVD